jgi:glycosyltransferase involved in cell wall biosynthesis
VDSDRFSYRPRVPLRREEEIKLLSHGILYIHRRFEDIIDAIAILLRRGIKTELAVVGDFRHKRMARGYYERLLKRAKDRGVSSRVKFLGAVSDKEQERLYAESDIFVSAAHLQTWGLAVFEALSSGLPAVISKTIGAAEVLTDGENVLFTEPGKPESLADAVARLVTDGALYVKLSESGRAFVSARISWRRYAEAMLALCREALQNKHA